VTEPVILRDPVSDGSAWTRDEITRDRSWIYDLDGETAADAEHALAQARASGVQHHTQVTPESFPVPAGRELFQAVREQLEHGRGFALVRGVPIAGKDVSDCEVLFAGLSNHVGTSVVQDPAGTHIDHVIDIGLSSADATTLLCLRPAKSGGVNTLSSALAIYNEILEHDPELLATLYEGMHYNVRGCGPPGPFQDVTSHRVPVFSYHADRLSCRFNEKGILSSEQIPGAPAIRDHEKQAIAKVAELASDPRFSVDIVLEPGDWLLMCNYTVFHNRSAYEDFPEPDRRRLLLRRWLNFPNGRDLTWEFGDHFDTGIRQGPYFEGEPGQTLSDAARAASDSFAPSR
jgi:hypothetical protein